jgi:ATP-dependent protease ClpP protease subunit
MSAPPQYTDQTVYVSFSAEINANTTESLLSVMAVLINQKAKAVHLLLSTPGGNVMNGLNLYNVFLGLPFELTTHNVGNVDSIGNAIFLAGSKRYATAHSTFMFHGVGCRPRRFRWTSSRGEKCSRDFRRNTEQSQKDWRDYHAAYQHL